MDHGQAARRAGRLTNVLLGFVDADGYPVIAPVTVTGSKERGILLTAPPDLIAPGGRRAALLAHEFSRHVIGQHQRKHTGWLEAQGDVGEREIVYAPHTQSGYRLPPSRLLFNLAAGFISHRGARDAVRAGFLPASPRR